MRQAAQENERIVRLSVVLDEELAEYVRFRAFEERTSRSGYVRNLVASDASRRTRTQQRQGEST